MHMPIVSTLEERRNIRNVANLKPEKSHEIIMKLKIAPEAICCRCFPLLPSTPQTVAANCPHQFSQFPFLLIMTFANMKFDENIYQMLIAI